MSQLRKIARQHKHRQAVADAKARKDEREKKRLEEAANPSNETYRPMNRSVRLAVLASLGGLGHWNYTNTR